MKLKWTTKNVLGLMALVVAATLLVTQVVVPWLTAPVPTPKFTVEPPVATSTSVPATATVKVVQATIAAPTAVMQPTVTSAPVLTDTPQAVAKPTQASKATTSNKAYKLTAHGNGQAQNCDAKGENCSPKWVQVRQDLREAVFSLSFAINDSYAGESFALTINGETVTVPANMKAQEFKDYAGRILRVMKMDGGDFAVDYRGATVACNQEIDLSLLIAGQTLKRDPFNITKAECQ